MLTLDTVTVLLDSLAPPVMMVGNLASKVAQSILDQHTKHYRGTNFMYGNYFKQYKLQLTL